MTAVRELMSGVDHAWLRMDRASNLMMIVGILVIDGRIDIATLRRVVSERVLGYDRFHQRVDVDAAGAAWWVDDERFDLERHVSPHRLDGDGDDAALQRFVARMAATPLDPARPLWQFQLVDGYRGGQALVARIHHCIADGIALVRVLLALTDGAEPSLEAGAGHDDVRDRHPGEVESNPWSPYLKPLTEGTVRAIGFASDAVARSLQVLGRPDRLGGYAQAGGQVIRDAARIVLMQSDTQTCLKGTPAVPKGVAWNEPLPLDEVRVVARALDASINDVLLSCVAGALRTYLRGRGDDVAGCEIRAMVPVNLRPPDDPVALGNRFGLVPLELPVGIANPLARLQEVRRRMDDLKGGYQALLAYGLLGVVGWAPKLVQEPILDYLARKATAVMTNLPGPRQPLSLAGATMSRMMFWVPQSGDIGVGVSILSYAGTVQFAVIADHGLCPDPQRLVESFAPEFEKLVLVAAMLPPALRGSHYIDAARLELDLFGAPA